MRLRESVACNGVIKENDSAAGIIGNQGRLCVGDFPWIYVPSLQRLLNSVRQDINVMILMADQTERELCVSVRYKGRFISVDTQ